MRWTISLVLVGLLLAVGGFITRLLIVSEWASMAVSIGGIMVVLATFIELVRSNRLMAAHRGP